MKTAIFCLFLAACSTTPHREPSATNAQSIVVIVEEETVSIEGFVERPGKYVWHEGMTLEDLLSKAGGPTLFAGRVVFQHGIHSVTYELSDQLLSVQVLPRETIRVLHEKKLEDDTY